jgi:hypothetical protein
MAFAKRTSRTKTSLYLSNIASLNSMNYIEEYPVRIEPLDNYGIDKPEIDLQHFEIVEERGSHGHMADQTYIYTISMLPL